MEGYETPLSDLSDPMDDGVDMMTTPTRVLERGESSWQCGSLYLCSLCYAQKAIHGDLCQECWEFDNSLNQMIEEEWPRMNVRNLGKSQDNPIIIIDDED